MYNRIYIEENCYIIFIKKEVEWMDPVMVFFIKLNSPLLKCLALGKLIDGCLDGWLVGWMVGWVVS